MLRFTGPWAERGFFLTRQTRTTDFFGATLQRIIDDLARYRKQDLLGCGVTELRLQWSRGPTCRQARD